MRLIFLNFLLVAGLLNAQEWQPVPYTTGKQVFEVHTYNDYLFLAYGDGSTSGLTRLDITNSFQALNLTDSEGELFNPGYIGDLVTANDSIVATNFQIVMYSADNGLTWTESWNAYIGALSLLASGDSLYIGKNKSIYQSSDLGSTLNLVYHESYYVNTLARPLLAYDGEIYSAQERGLMKGDVDIYEIEFRKMTNIEDEFYAVAYNDNIYRSTDFGYNWTLINEHPFSYEYTNYFKHRNGLIYASSNEGVYVSTDEGVNFHNITGALPYGSHNLSFYGDTIFVATFDGAFFISESELLPSLSLEEQLLTNFPVLYPNPSKGIFIISNFKSNEVEVFDGLGRQVDIDIQQLNNSTEIGLSQKAKGCYFVHFKLDTGEQMIEKVIVKD